MDDLLEQARIQLAQSKRTLVLTGAGISAESGVPTFRGAGGYWRNLDPMKIATPEAFAKDPTLVWKWYNERRVGLASLKPNPGHEALARLEKQSQDFLLVTQNVDGLHQLAGSEKVVPLHGSLWRVRRTESPIREWEDRRVPLDPIPPRDEDGTLLRPAILWFGEIMPSEHASRIEEFMTAGVDTALIVGTAAQIGYIQWWIAQLSRSGTFLIEVNPEPSEVSALMDITLVGKSGEVLPQIVPE